MRRAQEVLSRAETSIASAAVCERQVRILKTSLTQSRCGRTPHRYHAAIHLPLLVHAAITRTDDPAITLSAATTLLWVGAELHDNLVDGDLPSQLTAQSPEQTTYAAMALGCVLPASLLAAIDAPAAVRESMQCQLAAGLMRMFAGQGMDLALTDATDIDPTAIEESVVGKNGAAQSMYTGLAARLAGASDQTVSAYEEFGLALGVASQLKSDSHEMFLAVRSRDLLHGTRTLQIALAYENMEMVEREAFLNLLERAKSDSHALEQVRAMMRQPRYLRPWADKVNEYVARAECALEEAEPLEPAGTVLRELLHSKSAISC